METNDHIENLISMYKHWFLNSNLPNGYAHIFKFTCADELLEDERITKTEEQIKFLKAFIIIWENVQNLENLIECWACLGTGCDTKYERNPCRFCDGEGLIASSEVQA